jgi:hypothetical protein
MQAESGGSEDAPIVRLGSLWIGGNLSWIEQLCIKSFLDHGHAFTLYSYEGVTNAPEGTIVADANALFPATEFITHRASGSPAYHADAFRYRMIAETGLAWVDVDILCQRPWRLSEDAPLFGWEKPGRVVCNAVLRLPRTSPALDRLNAFCATQYPIPPWFAAEERAALEAAREAGAPVHVGDMPWGVPGPAAVTHFLRETGEIEAAQPQVAFYPIPFRDRRDMLSASIDISDRLGPDCWGVHLWNRRLRRRLVTHHRGIPEQGSFVGEAVRRHGIDCSAAPIPDVPPAAVLAARAKAAAEATPHAPMDPAVPSRLLRDAADPAADTTQSSPPEALSRLELRPPVHANRRFRRMSDGLEETLARTGPWLAPPAEPPGRESILIVTAMKNEAPFILEWIAYNRVIGVDNFLVYTNDCTDNTVALLDRLAELGVVTRRDNPYLPGGKVKPQHAALKDAVKQPVYKASDWIITIDLDEFIAVHVGDGTLRELFAACNHPNAVSLTWRFFGNGGVTGFEDRPVIEQFTRCAPEAFPDPGLAWGFKTMFNRRTCRFRRLGVHRPGAMADGGEEAVRWVNGSGRVMPRRLIAKGWRTVQPIFGYRLATLNHYALRSAESYLVKRDRGRVNHTHEDQGVYYWRRRNYIAEEDTRLAGILPRVAAELAQLKSDPVLGRLHEEAVVWHRARIAALKEDPDYARVFEGLVASAGEDATFFDRAAAEGPEPAAAAR